jgi:dihydroflavonol-4-reductase
MILVTGASGHIGNVLVSLLYEKGYQDLRLMVQSRNTAHIEPYAKEIVRADIRDPKAVEEAVCGCTDVFHLAGFIQVSRTNKKRLFDINVGGTRNVVLACLKQGVKRLVHVSSIHALMPPGGDVIDEMLDMDQSCPTDDYGRSKLMGTATVLDAIESGLDAVVVYPTGVIGPFDYRSSLAGLMFKKYIAARGPQLYFDGGYDFVDVRDVADGIVRAWQQGNAGHGYILAGGRCTIREMIETVGRNAGRDYKMMRVPLLLVRAGAAVAPALYAILGKPPVLTSDTVNILVSGVKISDDKAREQLGYVPRPLCETMGDAVRWYMEQSAVGSSTGTDC